MTTPTLDPDINMTEGNLVRIRKRKDKIYRQIMKLDQLTDDVPVFYSIISTDGTNGNDLSTVQNGLDHYFHNTNNNSLIMVSSKMYSRNAFLIASIGKPLPLPNGMPILEKIIRHVDPHVRVGDYNLSVNNLKETVDDLVLNDKAQVRNDFDDYNSRLVITYSRFIYHDRHDFNFNVDDDDNHYRLLDIERMLLRAVK